jgi:hypothetical protein
MPFTLEISKMLRVALVMVCLGALADCAAAQQPIRTFTATPRGAPSVYYQPPGFYGMAYGTPSFGYPRTYSNFSSPYGAGYAYGYAPYGLVPGQFGTELWRPGVSVPGYVYGSSYYYTFSYPARVYAPQPPVGIYAPGFGPPFYRGP